MKLKTVDKLFYRKYRYCLKTRVTLYFKQYKYNDYGHKNVFELMTLHCPSIVEIITDMKKFDHSDPLNSDFYDMKNNWKQFHDMVDEIFKLKNEGKLGFNTGMHSSYNIFNRDEKNLTYHYLDSKGRITHYNVTFYSIDKETHEKATQLSKNIHSIIRHNIRTNPQLYDFLINNHKKIICDRLPYDHFKFKVMVTVDHKFYQNEKNGRLLEWFNMNDEYIKPSEYFKLILEPSNLQHIFLNANAKGNYTIHVANYETLSALALQLSGYKFDVKEYVLKDSI